MKVVKEVKGFDSVVIVFINKVVINGFYMDNFEFLKCGFGDFFVVVLDEVFV